MERSPPQVSESGEPVVDPEVRVPIVGVGASAGGLEAFTHLLHGLPADTGMAFVLVQHLAPNYESMLTELVSKATAMPVMEVTEGTPVERNHIYIIPPNKTMGIAEGVLHLQPRAEARGLHMPIDGFFESLARENKSQAIGVILSGTASDGALGLKAIKAEGGITLVQDPKTARYDGMTRAAIAAGAVDFVIPIERLGAELARIARHPYLIRPGPAEVEPPDNEELIRQVFSMVRATTGVDFTYYKRATINRRMRRRMVLHKIEKLSDYVRLLREQTDEIENLTQDVFIHVTGFFRDPETFAALKEQVFPQILKRGGQDNPIRIWIPGCSTGEEAYSYAIVLLEGMGGTASNQEAIQIFATDVSSPAVDRARAGFYPESIAADVSPERLRRFFQKIDGGYRVNKGIRDMCVFARQDVTKDPPFSKVDIISCRNLLIYLGPILQKRVLSIFHYALNPGGHLVLGSSETIGSFTDLFALIDKRHKIYLRKSTVMRNHLDFRSDYVPETMETARRPLAAVHARADMQQMVDRIILDEFAPAAVVLNNDFQLLHVRGETGKYLQPARGDATLNVLKMAREGLMIELRTALHTARRRNTPVTKQGLQVKQNGHTGEVDIEVIPLSLPGGERHFMVVFRDVAVPAESAPARPAKKGAKKAAAKGPAKGRESQVRQRLSDELTATRDYLQSIIQDQEATNEELQSANEEILSTNEELQSTNEELETAKEELQSTNEGLNTVNEELQNRNLELSHVNSDLTNLLASVQIPIIMVSNDLRIRRFTPMVEKLFNVIPRDVDRHIGDFKSNLRLPNLDQIIVESIDTVSVREMEVQDREGHWYSMRVRPYKNVENRIDGAVITLVDIDAVRRNAMASDQTDRILDAMTRVVNQPVVVLDAEMCVHKANHPFYRVFQLSPQESRGRRIYELNDGIWDSPRVRSLLEDLMERQQQVDDYPVTLNHNHGGSAWLLNAVAIGRPGEPNRLLIITCSEAASTVAG